MQARKLLHSIECLVIPCHKQSIINFFKIITMNITDFLERKSQDEVLTILVTNFMIKSFKDALKDGCMLSSKVVYLAYLRGGHEWLDACITARNLTKDAALLTYHLYNHKQSFWEICLDGCVGLYKAKPNYLMAYYADREKTLEFLKNKGLWDEIFEVGKRSGSDFPRIGRKSFIREWLDNNAPKEWLEKNYI